MLGTTAFFHDFVRQPLQRAVDFRRRHQLSFFNNAHGRVIVSLVAAERSIRPCYLAVKHVVVDFVSLFGGKTWPWRATKAPSHAAFAPSFSCLGSSPHSYPSRGPRKGHPARVRLRLPQSPSWSCSSSSTKCAPITSISLAFSGPAG